MSSATEKPDLNFLASSTLEEAGHDTQKAVAMLLKHALKDTNIWNEWTEPLIRNACYDLILHARAAQRSQMLRQTENKARAVETNGKARIEAQLRSIFDMPLPHNSTITLGDATFADLEAAVEAYRKSARTFEIRARWLEMLMQQVTGRKKVKNAVDADTCEALYMKARDDV